MKHTVGLEHAGTVSAEGRLTAVPWRSFEDSAGWDDLARCASEPNPFAERWCLEPSLTAFDPGGRVQLLALSTDNRLVGIMPVARQRRYEAYPLPHLTSWTHANAFCGAPLVAHGHEHAFWRAVLAWADASAGSALFLHLRDVPLDGPLATALRDVCIAEARPAAIVQHFERALLASDLAPEDYFAASLSGKKRKELRRQASRLAEEGGLRFERFIGDEALGPWVEAFLALEAAGWKGAEGSALLRDPLKSQFFAETLRGAACAGRLERLALYLDERPVAMLVNFLTPPGAYSFKTAFDERLARFSPGVLLQRENLDLLARDGIAWCDSCAAPDHPMIERIWREKRAIGRVSIAIGGRLRRTAATALFRAEIGAKPGLQLWTP